MVEDIFALAVEFEVEGQGPLERPGRIAGQEMVRRPAAITADTAAFLKRLEEVPAQEGIIFRAVRIGDAIPGFRRDVGQAFDSRQGQR